MAKAKAKSKSKPKATKKKQPPKNNTKPKKKTVDPVQKATVPKKNSKNATNKKTKTDKKTNDLKKENKSKKREKTVKKTKKSGSKASKSKKAKVDPSKTVNEELIVKEETEPKEQIEEKKESEELPIIMECTESDEETSNMQSQENDISQDFIDLPQVDKELTQQDFIDADFGKEFDNPNDDFPIDLDLSNDLIDEDLALNLDCFVNLQQLVLSNDPNTDYSICEDDFIGIEPSFDKNIPIDSIELNAFVDPKPSKVEDDNPVKTLQSEEVINCTCGYREEDGLMIQCDICFTWQHALCSGVNNDSEVPDSYICAYCTQPLNVRPSQRYTYANHFLTLSKLPRFDRRTCEEDLFRRRESVMTKTFELTAELRKILKMERTVTAKLSIAEEPDHPKLYMWSAIWDNQESSDYDPEIFIGPIGERPIESDDCRLRLLEKIDNDQQDMAYRLSAVFRQLKQLESGDQQREIEETNLTRVLKMLEKDLKTIATAASLS